MKDFKKFFEDLTPPITGEMPDDQKVPMVFHDITLALDHLKDLDVPRRTVVRFLIKEVKNIFGKPDTLEVFGGDNG